MSTWGSFTAPRKRSYVLHLGDTVDVDVAATTTTGGRVTLSATTLEHARFESHPGPSATGRFTFASTEADRGRHVVTLRASTGAATATRVLTFVVRKRRGT